LRGVALFSRCFSGLIRQFAAYQPDGNGTNGQAVWLSLAAFGGSWAGVLAIGSGVVDRSARRRDAHCKFIVVAPPVETFQNTCRFKITAPSKNGALSNHARILGKSRPAFNQSRRLRTRSKVDRLG
jgi:hypothetical protein